MIVAFVLAGCAAVTPADAQIPAADEPPLIAGRVAVADGDAQIWRTEEDSASGQWDNAVVNDVVSAGTGLYTGSDGRNEVRVGPNTFRLGANSRGGFTQLDYSTASFDLEYGTLNVRLARPERGETTSVTVAGLRIDLVAPGRYRVDASDQGPMRLTVFEGHGTVRSASNARLSDRDALRAASQAFLQKVAQDYSLSHYNYIKPGIGQATRVLLRREARLLLVKSAEAEAVRHLLWLAQAKSIPIEVRKDLPYCAAALMKEVKPIA